MNYYRMVIAYDGTAYAGWQEQPDQPTVSGKLSSVFASIFDAPVLIQAASRTDAGVHALGQVVCARTIRTVEPKLLTRVWNGRLPSDILIRNITCMSPGYDPRDNVNFKTYYYHLFPQRPLPFAARYGWYYRYPLNYAKLTECLSVFSGTHDFRAFCTGTEMGPNTVRTINEIGYEKIRRFGVTRIYVKGPGFMKYMVRRIVGACVQVASSDIPVSYIHEILHARSPEHTLVKAPAHGLMLHSIAYRT
ncbi:tRNA pseudouridine(38-40) synthase TruA [Vermiphilus pyriformis]|nr:MAG: tRNA pseudouridine(38-40) synthase TruA [Vermiphilus pyriformis]